MPRKAQGTGAGTTGAKTGRTRSSGKPAGRSGKAGAYPRTDFRRLAEEARGATVYLAEKHSIALALADALPGPRVNLGSCIKCGDVVITWLSGHLLEQAPPEAYNPGYKSWSRATLPIIPDKFILLPRSERGAADQLEVIRALLAICPSAVNAADFDREGQLLVDEVLELVRYEGRVLRLQTRALDATSLRRELSRMHDNAQFAGMREAARARSQLDWLAGINLTRAMTIHGRSRGADTVLSLGRVQTPTLALVVARDLEIENFVPKPFYKLTCPFAAEAGILPTKLVIDADMKGADSEKRLVDRDEALRIRDLVSGKPGLVSLVESKRVQEQAPLPYNLTELQKEASARYGLGAQATLQACQHMYEAKFISYPRTDCQYLPVEQFADAPGVLQAVGKFEGMQDMVAACDSSRRSAAWNTGKVSAHHAIIPTQEPAKGLSEREAKVYTLICRRYAWQFLPPHIFTRTRVDVRCEGFLWRANGRVEESAGWTAFRDAGPALAAKKTKEDAQARDVVLPGVAKDEQVLAGDVAVEEAMTTPPARFTEGTLVDAMENIQRYIRGASAEDEKILKKTEGLGTVATRAGIIETLFLRSYIKKQGKSLLSTQLGRDVIKNSPAVIRDPLMTADMERALSEIQEGRRECADYVASYAATLPAVIEEIFATDASYTPGEAQPRGRGSSKSGAGRKKNTTGAGEVDGPACPQCGKPLVQRQGPRGAFWGCSGFPQCRFATSDNSGEPVLGGASSSATQQEGTVSENAVHNEQGAEEVCPRCGKPLVLRQSSRGAFYGCSAFPQCRYTRDAGQPAQSRGAAPEGADGVEGAEEVCPRCGKPLVLRQSSRGAFYGCSAFPQCRYTRDAGQPAQSRGAAPEGVGAGGVEGAEEVCPRCGKPLVLRQSSRGAFYGCSAFPQCRYTRDAGQPAQNGGQAPESAAHNTDGAGEVCPRCGKPLVLRQSARGAFYGCSAFPQCRYTRDAGQPAQNGALANAQNTRAEAQAAVQEGDAPLCPRCGKPLVQRSGSRGPFWGCSSYPHCRFSADLSALQGRQETVGAVPQNARESSVHRAMPEGPIHLAKDHLKQATIGEAPLMPEDVPPDFMSDPDGQVLPEFPDDFVQSDMPPDIPWDADTDALYDEWAYQSSKDEE